MKYLVSFAKDQAPFAHSRGRVLIPLNPSVNQHEPTSGSFEARLTSFSSRFTVVSTPHARTWASEDAQPPPPHIPSFNPCKPGKDFDQRTLVFHC